MKRFILCLVAFAFVATFASAQSQRLGSLAEIEKGKADIFVTSIVGMSDNKNATRRSMSSSTACSRRT